MTHRSWWCHFTHEYASLLDFNMTCHIEPDMHFFRVPEIYKHKRAKMNHRHGHMENILPGFLDSDRIHLSNLGYHIVTNSILVTLTLSHYGH